MVSWRENARKVCLDHTQDVALVSVTNLSYILTTLTVQISESAQSFSLHSISV